MASAGEMGVGKAEDHRVFVAIAGSPVIGLARRADMGVGRKLDHAEGGDGAGEGMAFARGADEGIDRIDRRGRRVAGLGGKGGAGEQGGQQDRASDAGQDHGAGLNHGRAAGPSR